LEKKVDMLNGAEYEIQEIKTQLKDIKKDNKIIGKQRDELSNEVEVLQEKIMYVNKIYEKAKVDK
jgi:septal ring factor EnvC (AmiA/AmiB activator)